MAVATATFTRDKTKLDVSERYVTHYGTIAVSAAPDTYATDGLTCSLTSVNSNDLPEDVNVWFTTPIGWIPLFKVGSTLANGKLTFWGQEPTNAGAGILPLGELAAGAVPAAISGGTIKIRFKTRKGR